MKPATVRTPCVACSQRDEGYQVNKTMAWQQQVPKSGILNINKPAGMTSHDVVAAVRRASRERRVGHAGTLDPMATGVLLICIGSATRVTEYLMNTRKSYRADIRLGISTDTYDAEGKVTHQVDRVEVSRAEVEAALERFRGRIQQVPPMFSAVKRGGKPLYKLARQGITVEREPRTVEIYRLEITRWEPPMLQIEVDCSKGTYIRSLAHDLGEALGCGAHLAGLVRLASGRFTVEEAESLETVLDSFENNYWMYLLHPLDEALLDYPAMIVSPETEKAIRHGQQVPGPPAEDRALCRVYAEDGTFIGLVRYEAWCELWQPHMVFPKPKERTAGT